MHSLSVILAFVGGLVAFVVGTGENCHSTCSTTATISVTTDVLPSTKAVPTALAQSLGSAAIPAGFTPSNAFESLLTATSFPSLPSGTLPALSGSALSSVASAIEHSAYPYVSSFGPGG
ncbi:MAG: hypothetical protein Q9218_008160, partial [Villophora microphyllina]